MIMHTATRITTTTDGGLTTNIPLLVWLSPSFPIGAFAYSNGLEAAVESGDIHDASSLEAWLTNLVDHGAMRADAVLLASAWRARRCREALAINELALALAPSRERALETGTQGTAFLKAVRAAWPAAPIEGFADALGETEAAYPVAVGVAAAAHGIPLRPTLEAYALAAVNQLVSAVLRLGPVGQSGAQSVIARLCPAVARLAGWANGAAADDLGTCSWRADIASMRHETQYSRLFRS